MKVFYYLLSSSANPMFGKNLVPGMWAKMLSANQIAGFLNQIISLEHNDEIALFIPCWYKFMGIKS